jgi:hypothetical protein
MQFPPLRSRRRPYCITSRVVNSPQPLFEIGASNRRRPQLPIRGAQLAEFIGVPDGDLDVAISPLAAPVQPSPYSRRWAALVCSALAEEYGGAGVGYVKLTESHEIGGGRRSPDRIVLQSPPLGSLWLVAVPRPRLEIAKRLVFHLI